MKFLLTLLFFTLICEASFGQSEPGSEAPTPLENWFAVGKEGAKTTYLKKEVCDQLEGQECYNIAGKPLAYYDLVEKEIEDKSKPIYKDRYKVTSCDSPAECGVAIDALNLPEGDTSSFCDQGSDDIIKMSENSLMAGWSFYCTKVIGYEKVMSKVLELNQEKKNAFDAAEAERIAKANVKQKIFENMAFGRDLKAEIAIINATRGLTSAQIKTFVDTFESIDRLLDAGSIETARESINALVPDEDLLRAQDKTIILEKIDAYLNQ